MRPAYDDVIQRESGLVDLIDKTNGEARFVPMPISDKFCTHAGFSHWNGTVFSRENRKRPRNPRPNAGNNASV